MAAPCRLSNTTATSEPAPAPRAAKTTESTILRGPESFGLPVERQFLASVISAMSTPYRFLLRAPAIA
jgi:hypothetical protein